MNERIKELAEQARKALATDAMSGGKFDMQAYEERFAELIVRECMDISKTWEDQLEKAKQLSESNAVGIVTYRISRQFGVPE